jgi:sugar phosphate permease
MKPSDWERAGDSIDARAPVADVATDLAPPTRVRYLVLAAGCGLAFLAYLHRQGFVRGAPEIQKALELNPAHMGILQSSFLIGYGLFQVPCGLMGDRLGARHVLSALVLGWSILTALTALAASIPPGEGGAFMFLVAARFLFGGFQAGFFPVWARVMTDWIPVSERGTAQGLVWMFSRVGGAFGPWLFFWLYQRAGERWTVPFWILGGVGVLWCAAFWLWFRNRPDSMPSVNAAERRLIVRDRGPHFDQSAHVRWNELAAAKNVWALCLMYGFVGFAGNFITNLLPVYLHDIRRVSPEVNTWITGAPLAVGVVSCALGGVLSDWIARRWGSRKWGRRFNGAFGLGLAGLALMAVPWAESNWLLAALLCTSFFFNDLNIAPAWAASAEVGQRYAGTVSGAMNMTGNFAGAVGMTFAGYMLKDGHGVALFLIFGCSYALAALCWFGVDVTRPLRPSGNRDAGQA